MPRKVDLNLDLIAPSLRTAAVDALERSDVLGFLGKSERGNTDWLAIVDANTSSLWERGLYEESLIYAWEGTRTNHASEDPILLARLFASADKAKLRAHGGPLPGRGPFTLYRGVAGVGTRRRHRGMSWTAAFDCAAWFACRYSLPNPVVLRVKVEARSVLACLDGRGEQEFIVALPPGKRPTVHTRDRAEIQAAADRWSTKKKEECNEKLKKLRPQTHA